MTVLHRFLCLAAIALLLPGAGTPKSDKDRGIITLPSGGRVMIRGLSQTDRTVGGKKAATMIYYSTIPPADTARLRAQAIEVWRSYFGIRADRAEVDGAILFVRHAPPPPPPRKAAMAHFVFVRQQDGSWRVDDPGQYLGFPKDYGVARAEAAWKLQQAGEHDRAIPVYNRALAAGYLMRDQKASVLSNRCWAYNVTKAAPAKAIADCKAALALAPGLFGARMNLAAAHIRAKAFDAAESAFASALEQAAGKTVHEAEIYKERARLYARQGRRRAALADMDKAVELRPASALMRAARCDLLRTLGSTRRALEDCDKALALALEEKGANNAGIVLYTRGLVLEQKGARSQAEEAFRRAFEIAPDDPRIRARAKQIGALK
jgi:tetratricopeptide (TPR) repeat protein